MTTADSIIAIENLVFEKKKYSMEDLVKALMANWEGLEPMRQEFLNAPKYGNDDDPADSIVVKVMDRIRATIEKVKDAWGSYFMIDGGTAAGYQTVGLAVGATPDGRFGLAHLTDAAAHRWREPTGMVHGGAEFCSEDPFTHMDLFNQRLNPFSWKGRTSLFSLPTCGNGYEKGRFPTFNLTSWTAPR